MRRREQEVLPAFRPTIVAGNRDGKAEPRSVGCSVMSGINASSATTARAVTPGTPLRPASAGSRTAMKRLTMRPIDLTRVIDALQFATADMLREGRRSSMI